MGFCMSGLIGNRYQIEEVLGKGGMGMVYRAKDTRLSRDVALKVIHTNSDQKDDSAAMLHREAQAIAQLHHPNIVTIYDYSGPNEKPIYIAMELIEGMTLTQIMQKTKTLPDTVIMSVLYAVSSALAHAHEHMMVHRDIKPSNIMIERTGRVLLMDFGIAKSLAQGSAHTQMRGTPNFMAPEQIFEQPIGPYTDIFALGTLIYTCAAGKPPFLAASTIETMQKIAEVRFTPLKEAFPNASSALDRLSRQCLRKETNVRPVALQINQACRRFLQQKKILNPTHHLALYLADILGVPSSEVAPPSSADVISELDDDRTVKAYDTAGLAGMDEEDSMVGPSAESVPAHLRLSVKDIQEKKKKEEEEKLNKPEENSGSYLSFFIVIFVILALLGGGFYLFKNPSILGLKDPAAAKAPQSAPKTIELAPDEEKVTIKVIPNGMLMVDGMEKGFVKGQMDIGLAPGWHKVEIRRRGREPMKQEIRITKGQDPMTIVFDTTRR